MQYKVMASQYCCLAAEKGVDANQFQRLIQIFSQLNQPEMVQEFKDSYHPVASPERIARLIDPLKLHERPIRLSQ